MMRRGLAVAIVLAACVGASIAIAQEATQAGPVTQGTSGDDVINGTALDDSIYGLEGNDVIDAGGGDDELDGGPGGDVLRGGPGIDVVSYGGSAAVAVSADGRGGDGALGEGDNVAADVEDIFGGAGADRLVGNSSSNTIDGGPGDDLIAGLRGADSLFGGEGNDTISARDGTRDRIDCGPGNDTATVDRIDTRTNCETVRTTRSPVFKLARLLPSRGRIASMRMTGIISGSRVEVSCYSRCRPSTSRKRVIVRRSSVRSRRRVARVAIAKRRIVGGTTFEVGVRAPGASVRCTRFRLDSRLKRLTRLRARCTSAARS